MKHSTIIAIAFSERFLLNGSAVTPLIMFSFALMILSAIVAGWDDLHIKTGQEERWIAYAWMLANCVASAAYSIGIKGAMMSTHFKDFDVVFYNNLLALPLLLGLSFSFESEAWRTWTFSSLPKDSFSPASLAYLVIVTGIASFAISYTTSWSVRSVGSTTTSVAGALNKLPVAVTGMLAFGDPVTPSSVGGVLLGGFDGFGAD
jgi:GDP-mannose transporter